MVQLVKRHIKEYLIHMNIQTMPLNISQLEISNIRFGKLDDNSRTPFQKIAFLTYVDDTTRLNVITPEFITETCGLPRDGGLLQDR